MTVLLPTLAAVGYGVSDFAGGLAARRRPGAGGLLRGQAIGLVLLLGMLPCEPGTLTPAGAGCAAAAGLSGVAGLFLTYRLMRSNPLSVVAPFTAVLAAGIPVTAGASRGERISLTAAAGVLVGLVAVVLIASGTVATPVLAAHPRRRLRTAGMMLMAGGCFGGFFVLIALTGSSDAGVTPLVVARAAGLVAVLIAAVRHRGGHVESATRLFLLAGVTDAAADVCFLLASRHGHLSVSSVVTALYPAVTVLLAVALLRERIGRRLACGLALSVVTLGLIAW